MCGHVPETWKQPARDPNCANEAGKRGSFAIVGTCQVLSFFCFFFLSYPLLEAFDQIVRARICWDGQFLCDDENDTLVTQVGPFHIFYFFFLTLIPTSALNSDYEMGT